MNKKGDVGSGITWFFAFILVFFIVIFFLAMVGLMAAGKSLKFWESGEGILFSEDFGKLNSYREMRIFLDSEFMFGVREKSVERAFREYLVGVHGDEVNKLGEEWQYPYNPEAVAFIDVLEENFRDDCYEYVFEFPFGDLYRLNSNKGFVEGFTSDLDVNNLVRREDKVYLVESYILQAGERVPIKFYGRRLC